MAGTSLVKKLLIKPNFGVAILNAPDGYQDLLGDLPDGASVSTAPDGSYDLVQLFVYSMDDLRERFPDAEAALKPGGLLWVSYPKKTGKIKTDITRDTGNAYLQTLGWEGIAMVAIDDTWSAMRFKPR